MRRKKQEQEQTRYRNERQALDLSECSFTPNIARSGEDKENSGDQLNRRTPQRFYEDMVRFERLKQQKIEELRYVEGL